MRDRAIHQMADVEDLHWWHSAKRAVVMQLLRDEVGGRCLDVGSGGGAMLEHLGTRGSPFGVDLSPLSLKHAASRGLTNLAQSDAARLPFKPSVFDVALALDVIEHHADPVVVLREMRRVLREGAVGIITVPAYTWMWTYSDEVLGHHRRYTRRSLQTHVEAAGLDLVRMTHFHAWLVPLAWLVRNLKRMLHRTDIPDDTLPPAAINRALRYVTALERALLRIIDLPFGLSIVAVVRAP